MGLRTNAEAYGRGALTAAFVLLSKTKQRVAGLTKNQNCQKMSNNTQCVDSLEIPLGSEKTSPTHPPLSCDRQYYERGNLRRRS